MLTVVLDWHSNLIEPKVYKLFLEKYLEKIHHIDSRHYESEDMLFFLIASRSLVYLFRPAFDKGSRIFYPYPDLQAQVSRR